MILRKTISRTIKEKKFQYAGVTILLMLAVMLYVSLSMAITTLEERNEAFKEDYKQETLHWMASEPLDDTTLTGLEESYEITLEQRTFKDVGTDENTTLRLFHPTEDVNIPYTSEGEMPGSTGEVALARTFADSQGLEIGDTFTVNEVDFSITGFVYLPDYIYMIERQTDLLSDPSQFGIGVTTADTLEQMEERAQLQTLGWTSTGEVPEGLRTEVNERASLLQFVSREDNARIQFVESEIEGSQALITTLPLIILALSIAMVLLLMKRRLDLQRKEIGTLMALGYYKKELRRHYLGYAYAIGLAGSILGILLGALLSLPLSDLYATYFNLPALSNFDFDPVVLLIGFVIPIVLLVLLTMLVINRTLKTEPLTLLKPKEMSTGKKSWLEKLPWLAKGRFIRRFRLRLLVRSKARSLYIFLGVMFSTVLLLFGLITFNSMDRLVETTYEDIQTYDYAVHYAGLQTEQLPEGVSPYTTAEVQVDSATYTLYGVEPDTGYLQLMNGGERLNGKLTEGAIVSRPAAAVAGVSVGDRISITNALNDEEHSVPIAGIADVYIGSHIYLPRSEVNDFLSYPEGAYTGAWQDTEPEMTEDVFMVENKKSLIESFESTSGATRNSVIGMAVFAVLIGVIVLTLLTNLIVEENSPSISLFKVLGYHEKEVSKLVLNVYTPIVFLSYFVSIPLAGLALSQAMNGLVQETGFILPTDVTWWMVVVGFVVIGLTYWLSLTLSKRKLKKVSLQEALKKQQD
ncbi:FtsX-like permease family protein [Halobacillus litoralis]|uniref:ABC transporter permease n=1 Tax=Halobacillus litoralis TaxID=45668 RepID=UPI001CD79F15|nr:ABC transporter permease [Halobacillus litoralis]MCA0970167.1 FtsX-like permease family protein [Halobacillus litoralis]